MKFDIAEAGKAEASKAKASAEASPYENGAANASAPSAVSSRRRMLGRSGWESDTIVAALLPVPNQPGSHASDPVSRETKLFMELAFKHPMTSRALDPASFHQ